MTTVFNAVFATLGAIALLIMFAGFVGMTRDGWSAFWSLTTLPWLGYVTLCIVAVTGLLASSRAKRQGRSESVRHFLMNAAMVSIYVISIPYFLALTDMGFKIVSPGAGEYLGHLQYVPGDVASGDTEKALRGGLSILPFIAVAIASLRLVEEAFRLLRRRPVAQ